MPSLVSWVPRIFRRPTKSVTERLEELEDEILNLESRRNSNIDSEKRLAFRLILYSFLSFGMWFILIYYYYWPRTPVWKALFWISLILYPIIACLLVFASRAFYFRKVSKTDERIKHLREEKQNLLEEVMETETFNKAQHILSRFDPLKFARFSATENDPMNKSKSAFKTPSHNSTVRKRNTRGPDGDTNLPMAPTPLRKTQTTVTSNDPSATPTHPTQEDSKSSPKPRLLRPILTRDRTVFDRILDALVGDGPDKRYALICNECAGHNGMALQEEFEYLAFRCCYCSTFNPPRRKRLQPSIPSNIASTSKFRPAFPADHQLPTTTVFGSPGFRPTLSRDGSVSPVPVSPLLPALVNHVNDPITEGEAKKQNSDPDISSTTTSACLPSPDS